MRQLWKASCLKKFLMNPRESGSPPLHQGWRAEAGWLAFTFAVTALGALNSQVGGGAVFHGACCIVTTGGVVSLANERSHACHPA